MKKAKLFFVMTTLVSLLWLTNCGGNGNNDSPSNSPPPPTITGVSVSPTSATLSAGGTQQFTATVNGTGNFNSEVNWQICDPKGNCGSGNAILGLITSSGTYSAPKPGALYSIKCQTAPCTGTSAQNLKVRVASTADTTKSAMADVAVSDPGLLAVANPYTDIGIGVGTNNDTGDLSVVLEPNDDLIQIGWWSPDSQTDNCNLAGWLNSSFKPDNSVGLTCGIRDTYAANWTNYMLLSGVVVPGTPATGYFVGTTGQGNIWLYQQKEIPGIYHLYQPYVSTAYGPGTGKAIAFFYQSLYLGYETKDSSGNPVPWVLTTDLDGNQGGSPFQIRNTGTVNSLVFYGGDLLISGTDKDNQGNTFGYLAKTTVSGQPVWTANFSPLVGQSGLHIAVDQNSGAVFAAHTMPAPDNNSPGRFVTYKLDQQTGLVISGWPKYWDSGNPANGITNLANNVCVSQDGGNVATVGAVVQATQGDPKAFDAGAVIYDSDGNTKKYLRWNQDNPSPNTSLSSCVFDSNNNLIVVGNTSGVFTTGVKNSLLIKVSPQQ